VKCTSAFAISYPFKHDTIFLKVGEGKGKTTAVFLFILALLCLLAYSNTFSVPFQFDDLRVIRFNFSLRDLTNWQGIFSSEPFRPFLIATFALNYKIGKSDPFTYHAFNLFCHFFAVMLFYFLLRKQSSNVLFAAVAALLMAVHPLNTEAVTYISSRAIVLCAIFYFASLLSIDAYFRKGSRVSLFFFLVFFLFAMLTKEDGGLIPFAALLYNALFFGKNSVRKHRVFHVFTIAFVFLAGAIRIYVYFHSAQEFPYPLMTWMATEINVWFRYLFLALWPVSLNIDADIRPSNFTHPAFWISLAMLGFFLVAGWRLRKTHVILAFWCAWFFLNLLASSFVIPLADFMAEHRAYISLFGFCGAISYVAFKITPKNLVAKIAICMLIIFYSFATFQRNKIWKNELTLWYDATSKSPKKIRPHLNLAGAFIQQKAYDLAIQEYLLVSRLNPSIPQTYSGLGICYLRKGNLQAAEHAFRRGLVLDPELIDSKTGLGMIRYSQGRFEEALTYFREVYPFRRESIQLASMMSDACIKLSYFDEAIPILEHALKLYPARKDLREKLEEAISLRSQPTSTTE
jgi:hypothetical protein